MIVVLLLSCDVEGRVPLLPLHRLLRRRRCVLSLLAPPPFLSAGFAVCIKAPPMRICCRWKKKIIIMGHRHEVLLMCIYPSVAQSVSSASRNFRFFCSTHHLASPSCSPLSLAAALGWQPDKADDTSSPRRSVPSTRSTPLYSSGEWVLSDKKLICTSSPMHIRCIFKHGRASLLLL